MTRRRVDEPPASPRLADFVSEAQETLDALDTGLAKLEQTECGGEADPEVVNAVFRAAHSLKGLAAMFGVERMILLAHALEDRLDAVRMGRQPLDAEVLRSFLAAHALFGRIVAEEAAEEAAGGAAGAPQRVPPTAEEVTVHAARLRGVAGAAGTSATAGALPADGAPAPHPGFTLDGAVRSVLTEYEEHRLRAAAGKGLRLYRARATYDLAAFGTGLDELKERLEPLGEVISTLPSSGECDPGAISFDLLLGSAEPIERVREAAGPLAPVDEIPLRAGPGSVHPLAPEGGEGQGEGDREAAKPVARPRQRANAPEAQPPARERGDQTSLRSLSQAVRVDIRKLDRLMNLVGELLLSKTSILGLADRLRSGEESTTLGLELLRQGRSLERKLNELQGGILDVRMVPLGQVFDKLARMARKLARDLGKEVEVEVEGGDVRLDKLIVEDLSDPLMHLVRNALDHAIEPPGVRLRAGKASAGRIGLSASEQGSHVLVSVADDGAGIDEERVREAAVRRGLLSAEAVAQLSRRDALHLVFLPGFSTAREVTALSGRGVGLDVVKNDISAVSGVIDLRTEPGKGTRFEITLPVTLAIVRALVVSAAGGTYAVPLNGVLEIVTVEPSEVRTIGTREAIDLRGATLPLVRLGRFFGSSARPPPGPLFVVVAGLAQERLGVAVDGLRGQQDVVVKPLGRALAGVRGISGATDLGDRRTTLVLDVGAIIEDVGRGAHGEGPSADEGRAG